MAFRNEWEFYILFGYCLGLGVMFCFVQNKLEVGVFFGDARQIKEKSAVSKNGIVAPSATVTVKHCARATS